MADAADLALTAEVLAWLDSVAEKPGTLTGRWKYNLRMCRAWAVESSATAVMTLHALGALSGTAGRDRQRLCAVLQSFQRPDSGLFMDPLIRPEDRVGAQHSWEHIWLHHSGVCKEALECLGAEPLYPLPRQAFAELQAGRVAETVRGLDWSNPWLVGEHFCRMVSAHRLSRGLTGPGQTDEAVEQAFALVENEIIGPHTGLPDLRGCADPRVSAAGLFKLLFAYREVARPFPRAERAVDSILALQDRQGGFGMDNMCVHWDCAWVLWTLNRQLAGAQRLAGIRSAGLRLAEFLLREHRKTDGGFSFYRAHCLPIHNSVRVSDAVPESDALGTYMSCECLRYAREWSGAAEQPVSQGGKHKE